MTLWTHVKGVMGRGDMATTREIYDEMNHITGSVGDYIRANEISIVLEVGQPDWDFMGYIDHVRRMLVDHHDFISEFTGGSKKTVGVNDVSIVALAKALSLPVISSETRCSKSRSGKKLSLWESDVIRCSA